ncbi:hypothetical protein L218DRAFT_450374 [Marasmius fiardii PR-910]|nr:hypothetical protein L218DRAFT_450374 [Marasmius fiardii PR-910]
MTLSVGMTLRVISPVTLFLVTASSLLSRSALYLAIICILLALSVTFNRPLHPQIVATQRRSSFTSWHFSHLPLLYIMPPIPPSVLLIWPS